MKRLRDAWYIKGRNPRYHDKQKQLLRQNWPTLFYAIEDLLNQEEKK